MELDKNELTLLIHQFLAEWDGEKFKETLHMLEKESKLFFDIIYFEECVRNGEWEEVEKYLSAFTNLEDNRESRDIFFEIRRQKYYEALDRHDSKKAVDVLRRELNVFSRSHADQHRELAPLLQLNNFRDDVKLSNHGDEKSARILLIDKLKQLIEANPLIRDKLQFPIVQKSTLETMIEQSLNWQLHWCYNEEPFHIPSYPLLYQDHSCYQATGTGAPSPVAQASGNVPKMPAAGPKNSDEVENLKIWKSKEIKEPSMLRSLRLPDTLPAVKVSRLMYPHSGRILSLQFDGRHKIWRWHKDERNFNGKATSAVPPQVYQPSKMITDTRTTDLEEAVPCLALTRNGVYFVSALGAKVSLFNLRTLELTTKFMSTPPAATCLAFDPRDYNRVAIGRDDRMLQIYDISREKVIWQRDFHRDKITGIVFSSALDVMVSSGADAQICVWKMDSTELLKHKTLDFPPGRARNPLAQTRLQLDQKQIFLLVVHETFIAVYEPKRLDRISQWVPQESSSVITDATYSCDGNLVYASFRDGNICVFNAAALELRCRINPAAYLPSNGSARLHPLAIAAHPSDPGQFAVGVCDGGVYIVEPPESEPPHNDDDPG